MDSNQLRDVIIVPAITALGYHSPSAVNLLLGTAAHESHMGKYIIQVRGGKNGAIGIYQCEPNTYDHVWANIIDKSRALRAKVRLLLGYDGKPPATRMASDLMLATVIARLYYWSFPEKLPDANDLDGLAGYWKKYWNTHLGDGTVDQFIKNYRLYVKNN